MQFVIASISIQGWRLYIAFSMLNFSTIPLDNSLERRLLFHLGFQHKKTVLHQNRRRHFVFMALIKTKSESELQASLAPDEVMALKKKFQTKKDDIPPLDPKAATKSRRLQNWV